MGIDRINKVAAELDPPPDEYADIVMEARKISVRLKCELA